MFKDDYFDLEEEELIRELEEFLKEKGIDFSDKEEQKVFEVQREVHDDIDKLEYEDSENINEEELEILFDEEIEKEESKDELDIYGLHLKEISKYHVLSSKEERELFQRFEQGDEKAKERIILCNLRLVHFVAKKYIEEGLDYWDLVQEGYIGLIKAVERFDWRKGCKFSTYAMWWIKNAILRAIGRKGYMESISASSQEELKDGERRVISYEDLINELFEEKCEISDLATEDYDEDITLKI